MRLESCKRLGIGGTTGISRMSSERSASIDSTDEDSKIRLDDPSLRLHIADSPTNPPELSFGDFTKNSSATKDGKHTLDFDPNMNTHTAMDAHLPKVWQQELNIYYGIVKFVEIDFVEIVVSESQQSLVELRLNKQIKLS